MLFVDGALVFSLGVGHECRNLVVHESEDSTLCWLRYPRAEENRAGSPDPSWLAWFTTSSSSTRGEMFNDQRFGSDDLEGAYTEGDRDHPAGSGAGNYTRVLLF